jgi:hypothetical protein
MYDMKNLTKLKKLGELAPEAFKGFVAFDEAAFKDGAIPLKYKELMAVAVALTTQCPYCTLLHRNPRQEGEEGGRDRAGTGRDDPGRGGAAGRRRDHPRHTHPGVRADSVPFRAWLERGRSDAGRVRYLCRSVPGLLALQVPGRGVRPVLGPGGGGAASSSVSPSRWYLNSTTPSPSITRSPPAPPGDGCRGPANTPFAR